MITTRPTAIAVGLVFHEVDAPRQRFDARSGTSRLRQRRLTALTGHRTRQPLKPSITPQWTSVGMISANGVNPAVPNKARYYPAR